jgi:hypothetical protein
MGMAFVITLWIAVWALVAVLVALFVARMISERDCQRPDQTIPPAKPTDPADQAVGGVQWWHTLSKSRSTKA